ncbi:MAG: sulfatase-like hydrolase/transferase [Bacteroidales bacterium]|nr:sulfatase-like hydrolase/transferase [Bacteroidales bacterium]
MNKKVLYPIGLILFWLLIFALYRFVFFIIHTDHSSEAALSFINCLHMDISMTSYFIILPTLFWGIGQYFRKKNIITGILIIFHLLLLMGVSMVEISSIPLYKEWGTTTNARAFSYIYSPYEMWSTIKDFARWYHILIATAVIASGFYSLKKLHQNIFFKPKAHWAFFLIPLFIICSAIIMSRGGLQKIPLSISDAFYSSNQNNNYTSVNKSWYFFQSLLEDQHIETSNRYSEKEISEFYNQFISNNTAPDSIKRITNPRPNVVMIILESWTSGIIEPLGGLKGLSPNFTRISDSGLLFTNAYCSGFRTDQGVLSILSGVPALPAINMMNKVELMNKIPSLINSFTKENYYTSVVYGGDMNFSNFRNYFLNHGIHKLIDKNNFNDQYSSSDWGVPDHLVFEKAQQELNQQQNPFFSIVITQSSHPPFDFPGEPAFGFETTAEKFKSSIYYSDSALGAFMDECENQFWYDNTLFVLVADHGAMHLGNVDYNDPERFHIPILLYGEILKKQFQGTTHNSPTNQHDLPATLLSLMDINSSDFPISNNSFTWDSNTIYFASGDAMTWTKDNQSVLFNHKDEHIYRSTFPEDQQKNFMKQGSMFLELSRKYILNGKRY